MCVPSFVVRVGIKISLVLTSVVSFLWKYRGFRQRKPYLKTCVTRFRIDLNIAPVFFHDALHRVEAQPCSLAYSLGCEKWFKDVCLNLGRYPWTVVANPYHKTTVALIGSPPKFGFSAHGACGIIDYFCPDLIACAAE